MGFILSIVNSDGENPSGVDDYNCHVHPAEAFSHILNKLTFNMMIFTTICDCN